MNIEPKFSDEISQRIWNNYIRRVEKVLRKMPRQKQSEITLEIKSHILESFQQAEGEDEPNRLLNTIDKLGDPEEFLKPIIADNYFLDASSTLNPKSIVYGLINKFFTGIKNAILSITLGLGYLFLVVFALLSLLKLFLPGNVGVFVGSQSGIKNKVIIGYTTSPFGQEIMGYWIIPVRLIIALVLYIGLTKLLRVFVKRE